MTLAVAFAFVVRTRGEWIWDDVDLVQQNRELTEAGGLWSILTRDLFGGAGGAPQPVYRPVPMLLHWLEARAFGVDLARMRLVNILVHVLNGSLLLVYLRRVGHSELAARCGAVLFQLHPAVTEPVMWLSGSHDLLGVTFTLAALLAAPRWWLTAIFCGLACLSKELYIVAPLLLLLEPLRQRRLERGALVAFAGPVFVFGLRRALGITPTGDTPLGSLLELVRCGGTLVVHYATQLLTFDSGVTAETYVPLPLGLALAVVVVVGGAGLLLILRGHWLATPWLWFGLSLAPLVVAVVVNGRFANRYAYVPLVAVAFVVAHAMSLLEPRLTPQLRRIGAGVVAAIALLLALPTAAAASQWSSAVALFGADVERASEDAQALFYFGNAVSRRQGCRDASVFYERAVQAQPKHQQAWHNLAGCLINERRYADALRPAERALELAPDDARAEYHLGIVLGHLGRRADALVHLERAHASSPNARNIEEALNRVRAQRE